jgi:hypothetical protein
VFSVTQIAFKNWILILQEAYRSGPKVMTKTCGHILSSFVPVPPNSICHDGTKSQVRNEGDQTWDTTTITTNGKLSTYSDQAIAKMISATTSASINSATGSSVDVQSHAENTRHAYEGHWDSTGKNWVEDTLNINSGVGDFEVKANSLTNTQLQTTATRSNVQITPTLPANIKTAIMLEPFLQSFVALGATDLGTTVYPALVDKGYATLRYTDSGVTADKLSNLGNYNVCPCR